MSILGVQTGTVGQAGLTPKIVYIATNDTIATVTTAGYLNGLVSQGIAFSESDMALVSTKTSPSASSTQVGFFDVVKSGDNWSLTGSSGQIELGNGLIFVGNASGVAAGVAMSGDATIADTGALTIANNAITTAKIANANVTLAKLATGISPSHIVVYGGTSNNAGGSATITITVTGMLATDLPFVQVQASTNAVTVQKVTPSSNTITVLLSADPGAATVLSYQVLRAAS